MEGVEAPVAGVAVCFLGQAVDDVVTELVVEGVEVDDDAEYCEYFSVLLWRELDRECCVLGCRLTVGGEAVVGVCLEVGKGQGDDCSLGGGKEGEEAAACECCEAESEQHFGCC